MECEGEMMVQLNLDKKREYHRIYMKKWRKLNPEKDREFFRNWYSKNKKRRKEYMKIYDNENRGKINARYRKYRKENIRFKLIDRIRRKVNYTMSIYLKKERFPKEKIKYYSIDCNKIVIHLGHPPKNNRKNYHIDHIIPLCRFDFSNPNEVCKAFSPENHQWLTIKDNRIKGIK